MAVLIETETELVTEPAFSGLAQTVVDAALEDAGCPWEAQVNILVTDDDSMRIMNRENRGIDSTTDVLSFPMLEFTEPGDFSFVTEEDWDLFDPETGELLLGDIVLSADRIRAQAKRRKTDEATGDFRICGSVCAVRIRRGEAGQVGGPRQDAAQGRAQARRHDQAARGGGDRGFELDARLRDARPGLR